MGWFERWSHRQDELAQGADADLVRDNRKRYRLAFSLLGFAILLLLLVSKVDLGKQLRLVMSVVAAGSGVAGLLLLTWARQEQIVLHKPGKDLPGLIVEQALLLLLIFPVAKQLLKASVHLSRDFFS